MCLLCEIPSLPLLHSTQKKEHSLGTVFASSSPPQKKMKGRFFCGEVPCLITGGEKVDISCGFFFSATTVKGFLCAKKKGGRVLFVQLYPPLLHFSKLGMAWSFFLFPMHHFSPFFESVGVGGIQQCL